MRFRPEFMFERWAESIEAIMSALGHKRTFAMQKGMSAFTPESGHVRSNWGCPLWANSGLMHRSKKFLVFDDLVGAGEQRARDS